MPSKEEKQRRKALVREWKEQGLGESRDGYELGRTKRIIMTIVLSVLIYGAAVITPLFDAKVQITFVKAFGFKLYGMPILSAVVFVETVLYLPMPFVFYHAMLVFHYAQRDGSAISGLASMLSYLLRAEKYHPNLKKSLVVVTLGIIYVFGLMIGGLFLLGRLSF